MTDAVPIRNAASLVLWRAGPGGAQVLMGQRGSAAVFMPSKYVFPGGAVDAGDHSAGHLTASCEARLAQHCPPGAPRPEALAGCVLRELVEETGLALAKAAPLSFVFRAVTPAGSPRRFDARFFLADAAHVSGDPDDFSAATDELSHLHWIGLTKARRLDLPFITEVILAEVAALLGGLPQLGLPQLGVPQLGLPQLGLPQPGVPFFDNSGPVPTFRRLT